jgi:hypothetical protein
LTIKVPVKRIDSVKFYYSDVRNILKDVNSIPELYYLANLAMSANNRTRINSELPLLITYEAYSKLITYYGGSSIYIPTKDELQGNLLGVMSYYYYNIKGFSWAETMRRLGLTPTKGSRRLLRNRWKAFKEIIETSESKIPDVGQSADASIVLEEPPVFCVDTFVPKALYDKVVKTICTDLVENAVIAPELQTTILARYE